MAFFIPSPDLSLRVCERGLCIHTTVWCVYIFIILLCFWPHNQPNECLTVSKFLMKKIDDGFFSSFCLVDFNFADFSFHYLFWSYTFRLRYLSSELCAHRSLVAFCFSRLPAFFSHHSHVEQKPYHGVSSTKAHLLHIHVVIYHRSLNTNIFHYGY